MQVTIDNPAAAKFIEEQLRQGRHQTAAEVVHAALMALMANECELDAELEPSDLAALRRSIEQSEQGQTMSIEEAASRLGIAVTRRQGRTGAA